MNVNKIKVLLIIEQCNPEWASVPLVGYRFYEGISQLTETTLVTHVRNKNALDKLHSDNIIYISESRFIKIYHKVIAWLCSIKGGIIWPLYNTLSYPIYSEFNRAVYSQFKDSILKKEYDIVHVITPMLPRYPVKLVKSCKNTPFVIGPVNGGVPFPENFKKVARQEFAYFNFLRTIGRLMIPGYRMTYERANQILVGSTYTLNLIKTLFKIEDHCIELFYENGITGSFLVKEGECSNIRIKRPDCISLLFVGRLVPYKGADMLIESISKLNSSFQQKLTLTLVGDGPERSNLESQVEKLSLKGKVHFTGWIAQEKTIEYYRNSNIFCFPSIREFGGAVVLEAMANGLPCIVVNNGGIGEYVTESTGFRINPLSREFIIQELKNYIELLISDQVLRKNMSLNAIERAKDFTWDVKAKKIVSMYRKILKVR
jgi:glycosyltransferase involved in cell wall biosynthesis